MPDGFSLVSVIVPTYNRADLLPRALRSVLEQDFGDLEVIVIDDGSTDNTPQIISGIDDRRLRYVRFEENRGIGAARNAGIHQARGEWIAFADSDDVWLPGKLTYQVEVFRTHPHLELILGNYRNINHVNGSEAYGFDQTERGLQMLDTEKLTEEIYQIKDRLPQALLCMNFFATPTVMFRSAILEKTGNFNTNLSGPEDFEFWWRAAVKGVRFAYVTRPLIERHKDEQSITTDLTTFIPRSLKALDVCEATAREAGRLDLIPALNQARHRAWRSLIRAYALRGDRRAALRAFSHSLRWGISLRALWYLGGALLGRRAIDTVRNIKK